MTRVRRATGALWRRSGDTIVALDAEDEVVVLTPPGAPLWQAIEHPVSVDELVHLVAEMYRVDEDVARGDIAAFLRDLDRRGLLETVS